MLPLIGNKEETSEPGPRCSQSRTQNTWKAQAQRPAKHCYCPFFVKCWNTPRVPAQGTGQTALSHSCVVSSDTDPGRVLSIPSRLCQHCETPRALPQGSSSPLLLTFSKPLQQGSPHSRGSSLEERHSWCTGAHPVCEALLRSQLPTFPPQCSGSIQLHQEQVASPGFALGTQEMARRPHSASTELPQVLQILTKPRGKLQYKNRTWNVTFIVSKITCRSLQCHTRFCSGVFAPCWAGLCSGPEYPLLRLECDFCSKWGLNVLSAKGLFKFWISAFGHFKPAEIYTIYSSVNIYNMH